VRIDPKAMDDRELVEDLLRAATNEAVRRSKQVVAAKLGQLAAAMGLPPGLLG
jgi:DNA-binding protein YbaB